MSMIRFHPIHRGGRPAAIFALFAAAIILATGCEPAGEQPTEDEPEAEEETEEETEEVSVKGPASIDHGGITEIPQDPALAEEGEELFSSKGCAACHKPNEQLVGPPLAGVTDRREPEWLAKMIMHPDEMLEKDVMARGMLATYMTPMPDQQVEPDQARALLAYLATLEE